MRKTHLVFLLIVLWLSIIPNRVHAAKVEVDFIAVITYIDDMTCQCIPPDSIAVGDTLIGNYIYESTTPDSDPDVYRGAYYHTSSAYGIQVHHQRYTFATDTSDVDFRIELEDSVASGGPLHDSYWVDSRNNLVGPFLNQPVQIISIYLWDATATALSSDSLPNTAPDLNDWLDVRDLDIFGQDLNYRITAEIVWMGDGGPPTGVKPIWLDSNSLKQNYPNPFNPVTTLRYSIKECGRVTLKVYNVTGQLVATLIDEVKNPSDVRPVTWNGRNDAGRPVASGVYFCRMTAGDFRATKKMVLLR